VAHK